ncbi:MAG: hypothetical protein WCR27_07085 [Eubacteriales bacterium]
MLDCQKTLTNNIYDRNAVIYKMHSDILCLDAAALTKDDYEMHESSQSIFRTVFTGLKNRRKIESKCFSM